MARTSSPDSIYRVSVHRNAGHLYAATHPFTVDASGKRRYSVIHWGTVTEDLRFIPGKRYLQTPEEIRSKLVFPEGWDLSAISGLQLAAAETKGRRLPLQSGDAGKAFGDIWLLERIADISGLHEDLSEAFGDAADGLLTLAYYPFLTGTSFLRFQRWQASTKVPSGLPLESIVSGSLASVNRISFRRFMDLRRNRYRDRRLCAVDSVVRRSSGSSVSDRRWGQKIERIHFQSTVEAVAYTLDDHVPVIFSSYPEAVTDARGMEVFRSELDKIGLSGITVITDRGYDSLQGLERFFKDGPMVMCVDVKQPAVLERIEAFGRFRTHPAGMRYDAAFRRWYRQYPLGELRLNLFFNPDRRTAELAQIDEEIASQQKALQEITEYGISIADRRSLRRDYYFFRCVYDADKQTVTGFSPDRKRILSTRAASGFYANITSGLDIGPLEAVSIYGLKYDQEKYLQRFRSMLDLPLGSAGTSGINYGIQILQYIALLFNSWLRHSFHPTPRIPSLPYNSILEMLDDFHGVKCVDAGDGTCSPAPFSASQLEALSILGL